MLKSLLMINHVLLHSRYLFSNQSIANEFDKISHVGVVMGDGASELRDRQDDKSFRDAFELAIKAFMEKVFQKTFK